MSCKYNIDEFKPFVSGKKRITPQVTDDWELKAESYNTTDGVALYSPSLNTKIYDLNFRTFLDFLIRENVTMVGNKIEGRFIVGQARVLRKESDYLQTIATKEERTQVIIPKTDYVIGATYETVCGESITYLGERYVQTLFYSKSGAKWLKVTKKYLGRSGTFQRIVDVTSRKFVKLLEEPKNTPEIYENLLETLIRKDYKTAIYGKTKEEVERPLEFEETKNNGDFIKYKNMIVYLPGFSYWGTSATGYIINDNHVPGDLEKILVEINFKNDNIPRYTIKSLS